MRIIIIGCPGAGKSVLTRRINEFLSYPFMHLDKVYHTGGKSHITRWELIRKVEEFANSHERWIIDGNYVSTLEMRTQLADTIVVLNIPSETCLEMPIVERPIVLIKAQIGRIWLRVLMEL